MKKRLLLLTLPIVLVSVACAPNAGALPPVSDRNSDSPTQIPATSQPSNGSRLASVEATTVALAPATRPEPTRTAPVADSVPRPRPSTGTGTTINAPSPQPTATRQPTATAVRFDPHATPTPLWILPPKPVATATSTPVPPQDFFAPTVVAAAPEDQFRSLLNYQYALPTDWKRVRTESSVILADPTGKINIIITEERYEPWRFPSALALGTVTSPVRPSNWDTWTMYFQHGIRADQAYEFQYEGIKFNQNYLNFVQWFVWGDIRIQVSVEVPQFDWENSPSIQAKLTKILNSFEPHDDSRLFSETHALELLEARLDNRPSSVFARDEIARARYELTCRQIFTDLLDSPDYFGNGLWQMSAQTLEGREVWRVYEPSGSVVAVDSNKSRC